MPNYDVFQASGLPPKSPGKRKADDEDLVTVEDEEDNNEDAPPAPFKTKKKKKKTKKSIDSPKQSIQQDPETTTLPLIQKEI